MSEKLIQIDDLMSECGYGYCYQGTSYVNNGYNCKHSECEETETCDGKEIGKCYTWSCPIANPADLNSFKELDSHLYEEYKDVAEDDGDISDTGSDWMVYEKENYMKYQITMKSKKQVEFTSKLTLEELKKEIRENDYFDVGFGVTVLTELVEDVEEVK